MSKAEISPPSLADIDTLAREALDVLPPGLKKFTEGVIVQVEDFPDDEICAEMELESPFDILGLYQGVSLAEKRIEASGGTPDMVFLYRRPILDEWAERGEVTLEELVTHVLVHEIGHHFGLSDADIEAIEAA